MSTDFFYPETINNNPLPGTEENPVKEPTKATADTQVSPPTSTAVNIKFPAKIIAKETIGQSINTKARRILGEFVFGVLGALAIGKYVNGVSGDIRITPDGIVARNINGTETITIDGATGDVTIRGTLQSGSIISGDITVGGSGNGSGVISVLDSTNAEKVKIDNTGIALSNATILIDGVGLNSANNFYSDSATGGTFDTSSSSYVDITSSSLSSLVLPRDTKCFIYMAGNGSNTSVNDDCRMTIYDSYNSGLLLSTFVANFNGQYDGSSYFNQLFFLGRMFNLVAGTHNLKAQLKAPTGGTAHLAGWEIGLIKLGA